MCQALYWAFPAHYFIEGACCTDPERSCVDWEGALNPVPTHPATHSGSGSPPLPVRTGCLCTAG